MRRVQRMADEHRVGSPRVELAVRLVREVVLRHRAPACERKRRVEVRGAGNDRADGTVDVGDRRRAAGRGGEGWHRGTNSSRIGTRPIGVSRVRASRSRCRRAPSCIARARSPTGPRAAAAAAPRHRHVKNARSSP